MRKISVGDGVVCSSCGGRIGGPLEVFLDVGRFMVEGGGEVSCLVAVSMAGGERLRLRDELEEHARVSAECVPFTVGLRFRGEVVPVGELRA